MYTAAQYQAAAQRLQELANQEPDVLVSDAIRAAASRIAIESADALLAALAQCIR